LPKGQTPTPYESKLKVHRFARETIKRIRHLQNRGRNRNSRPVRQQIRRDTGLGFRSDGQQTARSKSPRTKGKLRARTVSDSQSNRTKLLAKFRARSELEGGGIVRSIWSVPFFSFLFWLGFEGVGGARSSRSPEASEGDDRDGATRAILRRGGSRGAVRCYLDGAKWRAASLGYWSGTRLGSTCIYSLRHWAHILKPCEPNPTHNNKSSTGPKPNQPNCQTKP
jgi:hypothetical protein